MSESLQAIWIIRKFQIFWLNQLAIYRPFALSNFPFDKSEADRYQVAMFIGIWFIWISSKSSDGGTEPSTSHRT